MGDSVSFATKNTDDLVKGAPQAAPDETDSQFLARLKAGNSGFTGFSCSVSATAEDNEAFSQWDETTRYGNVPSKSSSQEVAVYGLGTIRPLGFTREELVRIFWRVKIMQFTMGVTVTGGETNPWLELLEPIPYDYQEDIGLPVVPAGYYWWTTSDYDPEGNPTYEEGVLLNFPPSGLEKNLCLCGSSNWAFMSTLNISPISTLNAPTDTTDVEAFPDGILENYAWASPGNGNEASFEISGPIYTDGLLLYPVLDISFSDGGQVSVTSVNLLDTISVGEAYFEDKKIPLFSGLIFGTTFPEAEPTVTAYASVQVAEYWPYKNSAGDAVFETATGTQINPIS